MADLSFVITLPAGSDFDSIIDFAHTQLLGRYENHGNFRSYYIPPFNADGDTYECNASDLEPAFISVLDQMQKFGWLHFHFRLDGIPVAFDWKITDQEMADFGHSLTFEEKNLFGETVYDADAAAYADEIYSAKVRAVLAKKTA